METRDPLPSRKAGNREKYRFRVRLETIKLLEGNIGRILFDKKNNNIFLDLFPKINKGNNSKN